MAGAFPTKSGWPRVRPARMFHRTTATRSALRAGRACENAIIVRCALVRDLNDRRSGIQLQCGDAFPDTRVVPDHHTAVSLRKPSIIDKVQPCFVILPVRRPESVGSAEDVVALSDLKIRLVTGVYEALHKDVKAVTGNRGSVVQGIESARQLPDDTPAVW